MLLNIFLGLIAKLALVCGDCEVGTSGVNDFVWDKVGITVLTRFMKQAVFKTAVWFYISLVVPLTNSH